MYCKKVRFAKEKTKTYYIYTWNFAYRKARKSNWEQQYLDRLRFTDRISRCQDILEKVLNSKHRDQVYKERFQDYE